MASTIIGPILTRKVGRTFPVHITGAFDEGLNPELVELHRISNEAMEMYRSHLTQVLTEYVTETGSAWGAEVLDNLDDYIRRFWLVKPKAASLRALLTSTRANPQ